MLQQIAQACREAKKWIMVNIQDHAVFESHRLNRDVWADETVYALLSQDFAFWQRDSSR
jgi:Thioredoxin-like